MTDALTVLISGASGMIGAELTRQLREAGHRPLSLVRREPRAEDEFTWVPSAGIVDHDLIARADAVVNLAGASLSRLPWTAGYKREILESRLAATSTLVDGMAAAATPPATFLSGSAVGVYGDRPGQRLTEASDRGEGFLSDVVVAWEGAARRAPEATRVALLRTGIVIGPGGGALGPLLPLTKVGLGSRLGTGDQFWPWISLHDEAAAIVHLLTSSVSGPVNLVGPTPATSDLITRTLAADLHRPYLLGVPELVISAAMQEAGREMLLPSQQVVPGVLEQDGFTFRHRTVEQALSSFVDAL